tara:strand:- start:70 stop:750 length:681 start_codon:yes stop_codon:yes gene_type:complete
MNIPDSITIVDFLILMVTLFLGYQIYRVLGMRTGHEKKRGTAYPSEEDLFMKEPDVKPVDKSVVMKKITNPKVLAGLEKIMEADPSFNPDQFVEGAKKAFEMILQAFIDGNKSKLKPLVSTALYNEFSALIEEREKKKHKAELVFFRLVSSEIIKAALVKKVATLTVTIRSEQTLLVKEDKALIEGDPDHIDDVTDIWAFERKLLSGTPTWVLKKIVEQEEAEKTS